MKQSTRKIVLAALNVLQAMSFVVRTPVAAATTAIAPIPAVMLFNFDAMYANGLPHLPPEAEVGLQVLLGVTSTLLLVYTGKGKGKDEDS